MKVLARRLKEATTGSAHFVPGADASARNHVTVCKTLLVPPP